jgi:hypothetical protein
MSALVLGMTVMIQSDGACSWTDLINPTTSDPFNGALSGHPL